MIEKCRHEEFPFGKGGAWCLLFCLGDKRTLGHLGPLDFILFYFVSDYIYVWKSKCKVYKIIKSQTRMTASVMMQGWHIFCTWCRFGTVHVSGVGLAQFMYLMPVWQSLCILCKFGTVYVTGAGLALFMYLV